MGCGASKNQVISIADSTNQRRLSSVSTNQRKPLSSSANQTDQTFAPSANQERETADPTNQRRLNDTKENQSTEKVTSVEILPNQIDDPDKTTSNEIVLSENLSTKIPDETVSKPPSEIGQTDNKSSESTAGKMHKINASKESTLTSPEQDENESLQQQTQNIQKTIANRTPEVKPLNPKEAKEIYDTTIAKVTECISKINDGPLFSENEDALKKFRVNLLAIGKAYFALKGASNTDVIKLRRDIGMLLYQNNIVGYMCNVVIHGYHTGGYKDDKGNIISPYYMVLKASHINLLNYSDACEKCAIGMCEHETFLTVLADKLREWKQPHMDLTLLDDENKMLKWALGIIHNVAMVDTSLSLLRSLHYTQVLLPYMNSSMDMFHLSTILALSDIIEESDCQLLQTSGKGIQFLLKVLKKALDSPTRKNLGFSTKELGRAVGRVARSDANKKSLVNEGALPLLLDMAKTAEDVAEERDAFESIWMLAFDDDNKNKIMVEPDLIDLIVLKFKESPDGKVRNTCQGILWTLRNQLRDSNKYSEIGASFDRKPESLIDKDAAGGSAQKVGHVMISYQWADQEILKKIRDHIKHLGIPVWMDIDNMGGSILQAMAEAIEDAKVILICMSHKYKNSPNCRAEGVYAFQKRKTIIPLIMERGYRPDGWLGIILGSELFYDFSGKYRFEDKLDSLLKDLDARYNRPAVPSGGGGGDMVDGPIVATRADVYHGQAVGQESSVKVKSWNSSDVKQWLTKHDLSKYSELQKLSGREISFLSKLRFEAPEYFYKTVETKLGIQSLLDIVNFIEAMDALSSV
ncbi:uncharacterized protein LOC121377441 [Gigantopelta aegis]|uniref:uncharacterized protein LOC121377441 n=1 Tax=Gigantopelta aegis TaxID=1735272 RepID=UPI001B88AFEA|nr:uncharacterized protein LOC121377441 [Gigantopelta aegis]